MLILAFDTATDVATSALVDGEEVLGERTSRAVTVLEDLDALLRQAGAHTRELGGLAVGLAPASPAVSPGPARQSRSGRVRIGGDAITAWRRHQ